MHFLGQLPHARVLALMARADIFALPSWDEAFGLVYTAAAVGAAGKAAALDLTWERNARLTLGVYQKVLRPTP